MSTTLRILHIEDAEADQVLVRLILKGARDWTVELTQVATLHAAHQVPADQYDLVITDLMLPDGGPDSTLATVTRLAGQRPVIVYSGTALEQVELPGGFAGVPKGLGNPERLLDAIQQAAQARLLN